MMEDSLEEPCNVLPKVQEAVAELLFCHISELESTLNYVMPTIVQTIQQIYAQNDSIVKSTEGDVLQLIKANYQVALSLMDSSNDILEHLIKTGVLAFSCVPSLPINVAQVLFSTFDHCKNSGKNYCSKSVSEILELFKKAQNVHSSYLIFLDANLTMDFLNEDEIIAYKEILDLLLKISGALMGVNMKSTVNHWKGFISFFQKSSSQNISLSISSPIQMLTKEINENLLATIEAKKSTHDLKVTSFLVKVALKLMEVDFINELDYEDILKFWITIYSLYGDFLKNNLHNDFDSLNSVFTLCLESMPNSLCRSGTFLKYFFETLKSFETRQNHFGLLMFVIDVTKEVPNLLGAEFQLQCFDVMSLLQLVFSLTKKCYFEYFCDNNSVFYEDIVVNMTVVILHFPNEFVEVEKILLRCVVDENKWTALIAMDIWCLVLKHASESVCRSTFSILMKKLEHLKLGIFHQTPEIICLKILTQRIFKILPARIANEEIAKYDPTSNLNAWKILNFRNIPLSHRYYVEFLMCDILEKIEALDKDCSVDDLIRLMEGMDIISYTRFNNLEINSTRLTECVGQLWSQISECSPNNQFFQHFVYRLIKITVALGLELSNQSVLSILTQFKNLVHKPLYKPLTCDILRIVSRRNITNFLGKNTLFTTITGLFKILLADKNLIVVQFALETFLRFSTSQNFPTLVNQVLNSSTEIQTRVSELAQKNAVQVPYDLRYFEKIQGFRLRHCCYEWTFRDQPLCKKPRLENDADGVITVLKNDVEKLVNTFNNADLTVNQRSSIRNVINSLDMLLK